MWLNRLRAARKLPGSRSTSSPFRVAPSPYPLPISLGGGERVEAELSLSEGLRLCLWFWLRPWPWLRLWPWLWLWFGLLEVYWRLSNPRFLLPIGETRTLPTGSSCISHTARHLLPQS